VLFPETMVFGVRLAESIVLCAAPPAMGTTWVGSVTQWFAVVLARINSEL
jgi:hypothetical protein